MQLTSFLVVAAAITGHAAAATVGATAPSGLEFAPQGCYKACESFGNGRSFCWWECSKKRSLHERSDELIARDAPEILPRGCHRECEYLGNGHNACWNECDKKRSLHEITDAQASATAGQASPAGCRKECEWLGQGHRVCWCAKKKRDVVETQGRPCGRGGEVVCPHRGECFCALPKAKRDLKADPAAPRCSRQCEYFGNGRTFCWWDCSKAKRDLEKRAEAGVEATPARCQKQCEYFGNGHNFCWWDCSKAKRDLEERKEASAVPAGCKKACENFGNGHNFCWWDCGKKTKRDLTKRSCPNGQVLRCTHRAGQIAFCRCEKA